MDKSTDAAIDVSGLTVDLGCARSYFWSEDLTTLRIGLLRLGCAFISGGIPTAEEVAAQDEAKVNSRGHWKPGLLESTMNWFVANWDKAAGTILGILGLSWVAAFIDRARKRKQQRQVHAIMVGTPGAGKSDLWIAWRDDSAPRSDSIPTEATRSHRPDLQPVPFGKFTIHPKVIDTAGSHPWQVLDELSAIPNRAKRVLIVVVAPNSLNVAGNGDVYDAKYMTEQRGYLSLPRALVGAAASKKSPTRLFKPDLVVLFITKFDLLSNLEPWDSGSQVIRERVEREFGEHKSLLESQCRRGKIPFILLVGSAKKGWGVRDLRDAVTHTLADDKINSSWNTRRP